MILHGMTEEAAGMGNGNENENCVMYSMTQQMNDAIVMFSKAYPSPKYWGHLEVWAKVVGVWGVVAPEYCVFDFWNFPHWSCALVLASWVVGVLQVSVSLAMVYPLLVPQITTEHLLE